MRKKQPSIDFNATQDFYAEGREEYALRLYIEAIAAVRAKDLGMAISKLKISARAFPGPATLGLIGECLMRQDKPADATLYFAAALGMTPRGMHVRALLSLIRALLRARGKYHALIRLREVAEYYPEMAEAISANPEEAVEELLRRM